MESNPSPRPLPWEKAQNEFLDPYVWLSALSLPPKDTFVVHGEPEASHGLAQTLQTWGWKAQAPETGQSAVLTATS